jgi:hypothetical protein
LVIQSLKRALEWSKKDVEQRGATFSQTVNDLVTT